MLIRLKKFSEVFIILINKGLLREALLFVKRYKVKIDYISQESKENLKKLVEENKKIVIDYIKSN